MNLLSLAEPNGSTPQRTKPSTRHSMQSVRPISYRHYTRSVINSLETRCLTCCLYFQVTSAPLSTFLITSLMFYHLFLSSEWPYSTQVSTSKFCMHFFSSICTTCPLYHYTRNIKCPEKSLCFSFCDNINVPNYSSF
jgi:hypothetical protein